MDLYQLAPGNLLDQIAYYSVNKCYSDPPKFVLINRITDSYVNKIIM